ncbi:plexin-D1 [Astyanax mexicanus]|uniref:plexin-D1 n=1 Tax=Astyanax mexicanus TaxID=7994 RepID=UPI0020CB243B|nr:plexin-D1 [Astyanax mexicanus]
MSRTATRVPRAAASPLLAAQLLLLIAASLTRAAGALRVHQAFSSPSETNNFAVDAESRRVYVGAVNALYQLSGSLAPEAEQRTGPVQDSALCHAPQLPQAPCEHARALADNHNKLLALDGAQGVLVACGSVHQGFCELRSLENVTRMAVSFPPPGAAVFPSMLNVAANHANASTAGLVFRVRGGVGGGGSARLLVAATYTGAGSDFFPRNRSREDLRFENTPEIAIRALDAAEPTRLFTYDINPSEDNVLKIKQEAKARNKLAFVRAFAWHTYAYVAMNRDGVGGAGGGGGGAGGSTGGGATSGGGGSGGGGGGGGAKESEPSSVLARICLDAEVPRRSAAAEPRKLTESYVQMGLQCGAGGDVYGRLVSVFAAENVFTDSHERAEPYLFGVFSRAGSRWTALCAFRFADVEERIREARRNCSSGPNGDVRVLDSVIQGSGAECEAKGNIVLQQEQLNCGAAHLQHPLALQKPLRATPLYEAPGISSVAVDNIHNHTVVFLGSSNGWLRKLSLLRNFTVANQWPLRLAAGESVHHIMTFDPNDRNYLYLMTTHHLFRVQVAACDQYSSCSDCLSASDAYCGWCTLESRCSIQEECSSRGLARSWISIRDGPQQCPSMTFTPAEFSRTANITNVGILVDGSVPDLNGLGLECHYGVGMATVATVHLDEGSAKIQTCPLPPASRFPEIPLGEDHVVVPVAIRVNGTSVVSGSFIIYDCKRTGEIHSKTACTSCLSTNWRCNWDQQLNLCFSDKHSAQGMVLENAADCPSVVAQEFPPRPTGSAEDITLRLSNVEQDTGLDCDFGNGQSYEAHWLDGQSAVKCSGVTLSTTKRSEIFHLNLRRRGEQKYIDSPQPVTVEVYSCSGGDSDCSQCWGREQQGHLCAWCENSCRPRDQCQPIRMQCPDPTIHKIHPLSGPITGGTLLTVQGKNLGRRAEDVKVSIGDTSCLLLPERYTVSTELVCETGQSSQTLQSKVEVRVSDNGMGHSRETFSYVEPTLLDLMPREGPIAGGTRLTIRGVSLEAGSSVKVKVNNTQDCKIDILSADIIQCVMPPAVPEHAEDVWLCVEYNGRPCERHLSRSFSYQNNPTISKIKPNKSYLSGGRTISVIGQGFHLVQTAQLEMVGIGDKDCRVLSPTLLLCPSPPSIQSQQVSVQFKLNGNLYRGESHASYGLDLEEEEEPHTGHFLFEYVEDPQFYTANKEKLIKHHPGEPLLLVINKGPSQLDLTEEEYSVRIGSDICDITFNNEQMIYCTINRTLSSRTGELPVTVQVGNFHKQIAVVQMGGSELAIIVTVAVCCVLLLLCTVALVVYCTKSRRAERYWQKTLLQMEEMESQIREEIRKGFAELQTDMTDLTKELNRSQGIPFLEYKQFVTRTFFPKMCSDYERSLVQPVYENNPQGPRALPETHPLLQDWQPSNTARPNMEEGITLFSTLLNNKHFLITFVHALEQQKDFAVRDRCNLASLLTIALHGKLEYYTSIMKELLVDLIDASASKNPKLMLRRTESVVEKMLTNWMSICMYSYLKETVGEPFFLLLCAIKQQINKGSIDAITGKARYTLNEEWLLRENIEAKPVNINVSFQGFGMDSVSVRVMNTDTICQVKEKILEAFYKNLPFSQWPHEEDVDLEWFPGGGCSSRILQDLDNTSIMEDGRKKLNTVFHYKIPEGASLAMSMKDKRENTLGRAKDLDTEKYVHLVPPHDELIEPKKSHRHSHRKKVLPEIYLTRLLSTKGTLQKFLDDLFQAILSIPQEKPPLAVKYFFDFLEEQADKRGITDPDTLHIWKTNSLPLRFWVNILKNPQFVFDIDKTDHMDACLSVIAQAFIDACSISDLQLGKDSPTNKLLYAKEIPEYKKRVQCFYKQIQEMAPLSEQEMNAHLAEESRKYRNEFNTNLALTEIYKYAKRYRTQVVNALDSNPTARRTQLQHRFEQVIALVEDNIYECCSEA